MATLQIEQKNAIAAYYSGDAATKKLLEELFGKQIFSQKITDRVNDWDDIIAIAGVNAKDYELRTGETADELAYRQWKLIALVYNEGEVLDAKNKDQYKYYVLARIDATSGCGLSLDVVAYRATITYCGVRLCFKREADARDAFNKFSHIYAAMQIN